MRVLRIFLTTMGVLFVAFIALGILLKSHPIGDKIGIVAIEGIIKTPSPYVDELERLKNDGSVKAVVLRVNSPGGVVAPCQEIHDEVQRVAKVKPVIVSMGSVAASGGLYVSVAATKIVADPGTITGSIGVILQGYNVKSLADKLGIKVVTIKSGKFKDILNPFRDIRNGEVNLLQSVINDAYEQFIEAVASDRHLPLKAVKSFADGRVFTGRQAKALGLVDYLGGLHRAVKIARSLSNSPKAKIYRINPKRSLFTRLVGARAMSFLNNFMGILNGKVEDFSIMYCLY